ncbi:O-Antigen ligase [Marivirga sericea]|uniref:O-Antigen ligase n=1 Tax=Marivirga sericea TaxID=1028 RepID=A0A1X7J6Z4_9BACT|nr:O-antigen ligase family protein [Marivirga sericea]SMG23396.1 O-Antigen ligase [Marivirga sericea]
MINNEYYINKLRDLSFFLFAFLIPMPIKLFNIGLFFFIGVTVIRLFIVKQEKRSLTPDLIVFLIGAPFLILLLSYLIHNGQSLNFVIRSSGLILIPFLLKLSGLNHSHVKLFSKAITSSSVFIFLLLVVVALIRNFWIESNVTFTNWGTVDSQKFNQVWGDSFINWNLFTYKEFVRALQAHPTYISIFSLFTIFFTIKLSNKKNDFKLYIIVAINILLILFCASRLLVLITLSLIFLFIIKSLFDLKAPLKNKIKVLFVGLSIILLFFQLPGTTYRFNKFSDLIHQFQDTTDFKTEGELVTNGIKHRLYIWHTAIELIKEKPLLGYGVLGQKEALLSKYREDGLGSYYNTHNQYLFYAITYGFIGLGILVIAIIGLARFGILANNKLYLAILLIFLIGFWTENLLNTQKGLMAYSTFLFMAYKWKRKN